MDSMHGEFRELYLKHWLGFETFYRSVSNPPLSCPLLIDPPDRYRSQPIKLFVVGRETRSWYNDTAEKLSGTQLIDQLMSIYRSVFQVGIGLRRSVFWQYIRQLEHEIGIERGQVLWSNIHKCDHGQGPPSPELAAKLRECLPVLSEEIRIGRPDVVIFFTGSKQQNDGALHNWFPDFESFEIHGSNGCIVQIKHPWLPQRTFKTDHPRALKMRGNWKPVLSALRELARNE
jgi:hypothetical protein